jgi:3-deoxy-D-manno-octulosonate 8-phosphate phosphatase KdsC-like HAD superfamily phosphatase
MKMVKFSVCPSNAIPEVKALVGVRLNARGGDGCAWELLEWFTNKEMYDRE